MQFLGVVITGFWIVSFIFFISSINFKTWKDFGTGHKIILVIITVINPAVLALWVLFGIVVIIACCVELPNILEERKQKKELLKIQKEKQEKQKVESVQNYIKQCRGE